MLEPNLSSRLEHLRFSFNWKLEDILWMLTGRHYNTQGKPNENEINALEEISECLVNAIWIDGRFGKFPKTEIDYDDPLEKFHWAFYTFFNTNSIKAGGIYESTDIHSLRTHPLRVLDWFNDSKILKSKNVIESLSNSSHRQVLSFLSQVEDKKNKTKDLKHKIEYEKLAKTTFWNRTEIRIVLFGETYAKNYDSVDYHRYKPELERAKQEVDQLIDDQVINGELSKYAPEKQRPFLACLEDVSDTNGLAKTDKYYGFYKKEEKKGPYELYEPCPFFQVLQKRGYPIQPNLIKALESSKHTATISLLQELPKLMEGFIKHGPTDLNINCSQKSSPLKAPDGTTWNQISFTLLPDGSVQVKIKSKKKSFSLTELAQLMSGNKTSDLFFDILKFSGQFSKEQLKHGARENYKSYISALRKDLKTLFQIEEDPIDSTRDGSYTTKFSVSCQFHPDSFWNS